MARFLIFGASGPIGAAVRSRLCGGGNEIVAVSRSPQASGSDATWLRGDLFAALPALPARVDAILSLGPLEAFAAWFAGARVPATARVVAVSSMSAESKRESSDAGERDLAARLRAAEQRIVDAARARACAVTLLRPTLIYGNGMRGNLAPIAAFARRWRVLPLLPGARGLRQPVHADDVGAAVVAVIGNAATFGRTYALGGGERLTFAALLGALRRSLPGPVVPLPLPLLALRVASALRPRTGAFGAAAVHRLREDLIADNGPAARDFGYAPRPFVAADAGGER